MNPSRGSTLSLDSCKSDDFVPQPLNASLDTTSITLATQPLSRSHTDLSELGRILTGIKDDIDLDLEHADSYRSHAVPEESLMKQLLKVGCTEDAVSDHELLLSEPEKEDHPVDGPYAFFQAFLVLCMVFSTWGANAAFGVFLNYYLTTEQFPGATKYDFALMGGMVVFLAQGLAPITVLGVRVFGQTPVHIAGIALQTLAYFLAAQCTKLWQIFVCQGVLVGMSFAMIFIPGTLIIPTWFDKRKALAMGIAIAGSGLGGLVYSLGLNGIIERTGDQRWALRAVGFINLFISVLSALFMRARGGQKTHYKTTLRWSFFKESAKVVLNFRCFNNYPLIVTGCWFGVVLMGYVIILYSFAAVATSVGLSLTQSSNILAILNTLQVIGRPLIGNLGDTVGRNNIAVFICIYVSLICIFWVYAKSYGEMIALAMLVGGPVGIGSLMSQSLAMDILKFRNTEDQLPAAWSGLNIIVSLFALPSEVIGLRLEVNGSYRNAQIYTSCCYGAGALMLIFNREWLVRQTLLQRQRETQELLCGSKEEKACEELRADDDIYRARLARYERLLGRGAGMFVLRMFYPIRV